MAGVVASALAAACGTSGRPSVPDEPFALGVASGDPLPDAVILWTRIVADPLARDGGVPSGRIPVHWEIGADEDLRTVAKSGSVMAEPALGHAVHVDATGLEPDTWYWYRFVVDGISSPIGRTRTTPETGAAADSLRFAFASCQDRQDGYWPAHEHLSQEDLDLVFFLGDYIYESPPEPDAVRRNVTPEPVDLTSYRQRWGEYKADPALQASHARFPWVCTWDDHEVANNYAADVREGSDARSSRRFLERRAAAYQAYYEHLPLRLEPPDGPDFRMHRQLRWGNLANFYVLDTRQHRSDQADEGLVDLGISGVGTVGAEALDESRTMLGEEQELWLDDALADSEAGWNVVAQQVVMSKTPFIELEGEEIFNLDQWDGYPAARRRLVQALRGVPNPVVLSGDIHVSGLGVLTEDPDDPTTVPLATEVVTTSISSEFTEPGLVDLVEGLVETLPNVRYVNAQRRGYVVCSLSPSALRVEFRTVGSVAQPRAAVDTDATWIITDGNPDPEPA